MVKSLHGLEKMIGQLALEIVDLNKDPCFRKTHLGPYKCKPYWLHNIKRIYLVHAQEKIY